MEIAIVKREAALSKQAGGDLDSLNLYLALICMCV